MRLRTLSIRTCLLLSYLALILLLTVGMWGVADRFLKRLKDRALSVAVQSVHQVTEAQVQASTQVLTRLGEYVVCDKAEDAARDLAHLLARRNLKDYAALRRDPVLRQAAIQIITTLEGPAGYTDLYDNRGYILFHPDPQVEGRNQLDWEQDYPQTTELIKRSFTENQVHGYFNFFDKEGKERFKYSARVHVPGTPFIVGAIVNIDEFFLPTQKKLREAEGQIKAQARTDVEQYVRDVDHRIRLGSLAAGLFLCLLGALSGVWFAAVISRPILRLRDGVHQVGEGDFSVAVPEKGLKEVVNLAEAFNLLGRQLTEYIAKRDFIRDTFGRYVTQEVVKKLLEDKSALEMGGETREVSLLINDLRGFTALTADMHPQQVITFLNRFLGKMIEILLEYHAVIDEILGDGILAFFGAPEPMKDHAVRAVACALQMQAAMDEINYLNAAEGLPHLQMGIGVDTGQVVVGNIGSERRTKYSVVGSHVNLTARIESYAVGGQVLISPNTYARVQDLVTVGEVIQGEMKGVPGSVTLYEVLAIAGPYNLQLKDRKEAQVALPERQQVRLWRLSKKSVRGPGEPAWITHLSETAATLTCADEVLQWEDVRLHLVDETGADLPGKIYGKVAAVNPQDPDGWELAVRFTSVSPEVHARLRQLAGTAPPETPGS
jgi:class 3 adenylate cyclase